MRAILRSAVVRPRGLLGSENVDNGSNMTGFQRISRYLRRSRIRKHRVRILDRAQFRPPRSQSAPVPSSASATTTTSREEPHAQRAWPRPLGRDRADVHHEDVERLRGTVQVEHTLARLGAERLWSLLHTEPCVPALGALTGSQAVQMVKAGLEVDLPVRLAGRRRREPRRPDLPGPEPLPGQLRAGPRPPDQQRPAARRPDRRTRKANGDATGWRRSSPTPRPASAAR